MDSTSDYRKTAAPIIAEILKEHPERDADQERALREAYPFAQRAQQYKVWLDEIKRQRSRKDVPVREGQKLVFGSKDDPYGEK